MRKVEFLKREMDRLDISQKKLAELLHCSRSTVCKRLKNPNESFLKRAAKAIGTARLKAIVFGDTTSNVYFDQARIEDKTTLDRMEQEALELVEAIRELKKMRGYHNASSIEDCSRELARAYMEVAEQNKDVNHCNEHVDIALDDFGLDLTQRDKKCNLKYIDQGYVSQKTKIDTCFGQASVSI